MADTFVILISVLAVTASARLHKLAGGSLRLPTISVWFFYIYVVTIYVGSVSMVVGWDQRSVNFGMTDRDILLKMWGLTTAVLFLVPIGMISTNIIAGFKPRTNLLAWRTRPMQTLPFANGKPFGPVFWVMVTISIIVTGYYINQVETLPISVLFQDLGRFEMSKLRSLATNQFGGSFHHYQFFFKHMLPVLSLIALANFIGQNGLSRLRWVTAFTITFAICLFCTLMTGEKGRIVTYLVMIAIFLLLVINLPRVRLSYIVIIAAIVIPAMYFTHTGFGVREGNIFELFPVRRIVVGQIEPLYMYLAVFPEEENYLNGRSLPNPRGLLPFDQYRLPRKISLRMKELTDNRSEVVGSAPTVFFGEMYANFAVPGALISMFMVGVLVQLAHIVTIRYLRKTVLTVPLMAWAASHYAALSWTSLSAYILDDTMVKLVLFLFAMYLATRFLSPPAVTIPKRKLMSFTTSKKISPDSST